MTPESQRIAIAEACGWVRKFEVLARAGHFILIVSEKNRVSYGHGGMAAGKGTGAIEYKAWFGVNMISEGHDDSTSPIECQVFKNRHRQKRGRICWLERDASGFWFNEWAKHAGDSNE